MSTVQEIETAIQKLPRQDLDVLRDWFDEYVEEHLEVTDAFKAKVDEGLRDIAEGRTRTRQP